jgi:hypothetical protein
MHSLRNFQDESNSFFDIMQMIIKELI